MAGQVILSASENYKEVDVYLESNRVKKIFLVCGASISLLRIDSYFQDLEVRMGIQVIRFSDFKPNPLYESVVEGIRLFHKEKCDLIMAVGGGSAIDVAKCIKLYLNMDPCQNYLEQRIIPNDISLFAVPTTAGTGSEATCYAVVYFNGEKQSVSDCSCIPSTVLMDASLLKSLPVDQKKYTMLDALCHAIESFWSIHSTKESKIYSRKALQAILNSKDSYLKNEDTGNKEMLYAANMAGKAINITQTTAGHAMCYKLTSLYGVAHGYAAALCVSKLWIYMMTHLDQCIDPRGKRYLHSTFEEIAEAMECNTVVEAVRQYEEMMTSFKLKVPIPRAEDFEILKISVNPVRLKNNPVRLDTETIDRLYHQILGDPISKR